MLPDKIWLAYLGPGIITKTKLISELIELFNQVTRLEPHRDVNLLEVGFSSQEALNQAYKEALLYSCKKAFNIKPCEENEIPVALNVSNLPSTLSLATIQQEFYTGLESYGRIITATIKRSQLSSQVAAGKASVLLAQSMKHQTSSWNSHPPLIREATVRDLPVWLQAMPAL
ncbi:hypothetical protein DSO57_1014014 [Entomophthora muscae]|uniref:Uncharacterized protein n=1 Tax=Entomophthora muscae TaxID=34485 RepID=A0ACC2SIJ0_9FUNG|nr:hypothetical protein DSO57_1014014 [Entomophthora muscae]